MKPDVAVTLRTADWARDQHVLQSIREAVFVHEQNVPVELEWDGLDPDCAHVIAYVDNDEAVATGRLLPDGHIGRIAVLKAWRRHGIGSRVLQSLIERIDYDGGTGKLTIHWRLTGFGQLAEEIGS